MKLKSKDMPKEDIGERSPSEDDEVVSLTVKIRDLTSSKSYVAFH